MLFSPFWHPLPQISCDRRRERAFLFLTVAGMEQHVANLSQALPGKVLLPDSHEYTESLDTYFSAQESQIKPACIVRPQTTEDVVTVLSLLVRANRLHGIGSLKFAIRSGGHACFAESANASDGVTIDLRGLNSIEVKKDYSQVSIGTGASWGEVYRTLDPLGLAVPGGRHSQVGVGGLTLGGKTTLSSISIRTAGSIVALPTLGRAWNSAHDDRLGEDLEVLEP